jgi:hypothetical protein
MSVGAGRRGWLAEVFMRWWAVKVNATLYDKMQPKEA